MVVDPVAPLDIDYLPTEYYFDSAFDFLIPSRDVWDADMIYPGTPEYIYRFL